MPKFLQPKDESVPEGVYEVEVANATLTASRNGNEMIVLKLRVPGKKASVFLDHLVFTPQSAWKVAQCLTAFGVALADGDNVGASIFDGRRAWAQLTNDVYRDRIRNKVAKWIAPEQVTRATSQTNAANGAEVKS